MASPGKGVSVENLRTALRDRISETSFRTVAREIGMSPSGLHSFLGGTSPQYSTIRKITGWYVRESRRDPGQAKVATMRAALDILVEHLPEKGRDEAIASILEAIQRATVDGGVPVPNWLDRVR